MIFHHKDKIPDFVQRTLDKHSQTTPGLIIPDGYMLFIAAALRTDTSYVQDAYQILKDHNVPDENIRFSPNYTIMTAAVPLDTVAVIKLTHDIPTGDWNPLVDKETTDTQLDTLGRYNNEFS